MEENISYCREYALRGIGAKRTRYEEHLIRLEEKMSQEGLSPEELEEELLEQATKGLICDKSVNDFFCWMKDAVRSKEFKNHLASDISEIQLTRQDCESLPDDFVYLLQGHDADKLHFYKQFLTFQCAKFCCTYEVLQTWIPDFVLAPNEEDFISKVLYDYISVRKRLHIEKEAAGHYAETYRVCDKINCRSYLKTREYLTELRGRQKSWKRCDLSVVFGAAGKEEEYSVDSNYSSSPISPEISRIISIIYDATRRYFSRIKGHPDKLDVNHMKSVISSMEKLGVDIAYFPFCYLMVCVAGTGALFSTIKVILGSNMSKTLQQPYYQKPSKKVQRISRIRFLDELNRIVGLDIEKRAHNWNLFLQVHGSVIESIEEAVLWREILYDESGKKDKENIPPIETALLCHKLLRQCLPVQEQYLYCYCSSSSLQKGGYAKFLEKWPDVLEGCIKRIKERTSGNNSPQKKYLKACSGITYDINYIRQLCEKSANSIRWGTIPHASNADLWTFCRSLYNVQGVTDAGIDKDVKELKNLLIETALRHILSEDAANKLEEQAEKIFNKETEFRISFSNL